MITGTYFCSRFKLFLNLFNLLSDYSKPLFVHTGNNMATFLDLETATTPELWSPELMPACLMPLQLVLKLKIIRPVTYQTMVFSTKDAFGWISLIWTEQEATIHEWNMRAYSWFFSKYKTVEKRKIMSSNTKDKNKQKHIRFVTSS